MNSNFLDALNLASLIIGIQNLNENREQSAHNDVQSANDRQAKFLLEEINRQFEYQNKMLAEILEILEESKTERR